MKQFVSVIILILFVFPLCAEVSDSVWNALIDRKIVVEKLDGSEVRGTLIGVGDFDVNLMKDDGTIVTVEREDVEEVRGVASKTEKSSQSVQEDIPPGSSYFLINPLGLLQTGPIFEYGFLVSPELYVAPRIRILGMGLLTQVLAGAADDDWLRIYSFSAGVGIFGQNSPDGGPNRVYYGGTLELGFSSEYGDVGTDYEWEGSTNLLITGASFGYKWRKPTRFFMNLGIFAGVGFSLASDWYYVDDPGTVYTSEEITYFVGGIELAVGWEQE